MSNNQWESTGIYEHPVKHQAGTYGQICKSQAGIYYLKVGGSHMSCPQGWASKIHAEETGQVSSPMSVRDIPEQLRNQFKAKAILEGKTMQQKIIELMEEYISD